MIVTGDCVSSSQVQYSLFSISLLLFLSEVHQHLCWSSSVRFVHKPLVIYKHVVVWNDEWWWWGGVWEGWSGSETQSSSLLNHCSNVSKGDRWTWSIRVSCFAHECNCLSHQLVTSRCHISRNLPKEKEAGLQPNSLKWDKSISTSILNMSWYVFPKIPYLQCPQIFIFIRLIFLSCLFQESNR